MPKIPTNREKYFRTHLKRHIRYLELLIEDNPSTFSTIGSLQHRVEYSSILLARVDISREYRAWCIQNMREDWEKLMSLKEVVSKQYHAGVKKDYMNYDRSKSIVNQYVRVAMISGKDFHYIANEIQGLIDKLINLPPVKEKDYLSELGMDVPSLPNKDLIHHIKELSIKAYKDNTETTGVSPHSEALKILEDELFSRLKLLDTYIEAESVYESILAEDKRKMNYRKKGRYS